MNSEELELSLRSEFEAQLKRMFADMQHEVGEFQNKIDAELGKHRTLMIEALGEFSTKMTSEPQLDNMFSQTIVEHLRIARDDGAKLAASSLAQAEAIEGSTSSVSFNFARDAVNDISSQTSQAAILQALVRHCEQFAPRGVFFIVRNEHFIGWQDLGSESHADGSVIRELNFPISSDTVLSESVQKLTTCERNGASAGDESMYLGRLGFGRPARMRAIPLVARGRGVAALYVDGGVSDRPVNIEALEMLVRVAGLTVELLASNQAARPNVVEQPAVAAKTAEVRENIESFDPYVEPAVAPQYEATSEPQDEAAPEPQFEATSEPHFEATSEPQFEALPESQFDVQPAEVEQHYESLATEPEPVVEQTPSFEVESFDRQSFEQPSQLEEVQVVEAVETEPVTEEVVGSEPTGFAFSSNGDYETPVQHFEDADVVETPAAVSVESSPDVDRRSLEPEMAATQSGTRRLDLPIEVAEEEVGTHTKARRFARLLVSEIKLYNEDKVKQGRESGDLYDRLKEAIDRSREMYDKRVEPPVASRFDYFHYELVNDLAEGDEARLGGGYPGSAI